MPFAYPFAYPFGGPPASSGGVPVALPSAADNALGVDILAPDDLDPRFILCNGFVCFGQDIVHRLSTDPGTLVDDADYGYNVRQLLNKGYTNSELAGFAPVIGHEVEKDPRAQDATVTIVAVTGLYQLQIGIQGQTAQGPYTLVLGVNNLTVALLASQAVS